MNIVLLFEGTGQGVEGKFTNVTRLHDLLVEDDGQNLWGALGSVKRDLSGIREAVLNGK